MTKLELFWARITRANPGFGKADDTKVTMTVGAVRKLVAKAHKDGFHCCLEMTKSLEGLGKTSDPDADIFDLLKKGMGK